jgi:virulence-associated protein VagC
MEENRLFKDYTVERLIFTLNTVKIAKYGDRLVISPLTAEQMAIFDYFKRPYPRTEIL